LWLQAKELVQMAGNCLPRKFRRAITALLLPIAIAVALFAQVQGSGFRTQGFEVFAAADKAKTRKQGFGI
jgi:hypothetical protein